MRLIEESEIYALFGEDGRAALHVGDIDALPRVEVRDGRWILAGSNSPKLRRKKVSFFYCSECGRMVDLYKNEVLLEEYPFCHCGAKMEVGAEHERLF